MPRDLPHKRFSPTPRVRKEGRLFFLARTNAILRRMPASGKVIRRGDPIWHVYFYVCE